MKRTSNKVRAAVIAMAVVFGLAAAPIPSALAAPVRTPGAPVGLSAQPDDGQLAVRWGAAKPNAAPVTGYRTALRSYDKARRRWSPWSVSGIPATARSRVWTTVANDRIYQVRVAAVNRFGGGVAAIVDAVVGPTFTNAGTLVPVARVRLIDTRPNGATVDRRYRRSGPTAAGRPFTLAVAGRGALPRSGIRAVLLSATLTGTGRPGRVWLWAAGTPRPALATVINTPARGTIRIQRIVPVGPSGGVAVLATAALHLTADATAHAAAPVASSRITVPTTTRMYSRTDIVAASTTTGGLSITVAAAAVPPVIGGHVAVGPTAQLPDGLLARVVRTQVLKNRSVRAVVVRAPLDEVFANVRASFSGAASPTLVSAQAGAAESRTRTNSIAAPRTAWECRSGGSVVPTESLWSHTPPPVTIALDKTRAAHSFDAGNAITGRAPVTRVTFAGDSVALVSAGALQGFSCSLSAAFRRAHRLEFGLGSVGPVPINLSLEPNFTFAVDAAGSATLSQRQHFAFAFAQRGAGAPALTNTVTADPISASVSPPNGVRASAAGSLALTIGRGTGLRSAEAALSAAFGPKLATSAPASKTSCTALSSGFDAAALVRSNVWTNRWRPFKRSASTAVHAVGEVCAATGSAGVAPLSAAPQAGPPVIGGAAPGSPAPTPPAPVPSPGAPPAPPPGSTIRVRFQSAGVTPPAGYFADWGSAYGARTGAGQGSGNTYGWVRVGTSTPLDLTKNGRVRLGTLTKDPRLTGLLHMDFPASSGTGGTAVPGAWEYPLPVGSYAVTVSVGDAADNYNSVHQVNVEDQNAVGQEVLGDEDRFRTETRIVRVNDGRLTLSPTGGSNTKINYVEISPLSGSAQPRIAGVTPANLVTGAAIDLSVTAGLAVVAGGIDVATLSRNTVQLTVAGDGSSVPANVNTSGGGDVIVLTPDAPLITGTTYRVDITSAVRDVAGNAFEPWSSIFTVGTASEGTGIPGVAFEKLPTSATGQLFTSVTVGPDNKLYAATLDGFIFRYPIAANGSLGSGEQIDTVRRNAGDQPRTIIGLAFDPAATAGDLILWVTENRQYLGTADVPDWTGKIVKLTGSSLQTAKDVVVGLPRSARDHESNSLAFKNGKLYLTQGSNTAMGAPDSAWAFRDESVLSAAVLQLDPAKLPATLPLNVKTADGGNYNPFATNAPLTLYATGVRNAYDLLWHSNGKLYVPTNGSARGGAMPGTPSTLPASCNGRIDGAWSGPAVPAVANNPVDETDWVFRVAAGGYYGHPNAARCEWAFNGGNPTWAADRFEATAYPVGVAPDRNYRKADVFDAGMHASANGTIEYKGTAFGGALTGKLIVVRYSASQDLMVLDPSGIDDDGTTGKIVSRTLGVVGFKNFLQPLDIAQHVPSGNLYVTELGGMKITRLVPSAP